MWTLYVKLVSGYQVDFGVIQMCILPHTCKQVPFVVLQNL
jgi:hypothetical protein